MIQPCCHKIYLPIYLLLTSLFLFSIRHFADDSARPQTCLSVQHLTLTIYLNGSLRFLALSLFSLLLKYSCFTSCYFLLCSKVNPLPVYIQPLFFGFPSHLGHHRAESRVPCAAQLVLDIYINTQQCTYVKPSLPVHPITPLLPLVSVSLFSTSMSPFPFCKQVRMYYFSRFHIQTMLHNICFSLSRKSVSKLRVAVVEQEWCRKGAGRCL